MFNSCAVLTSEHRDARKRKEFNNKVAPPHFDIQFLDVAPPTPLSRIIDEYVSVSEVIFHGLFEFLNVSLGRYVDAHDDNVGFVVHLKDFGFCRFKPCDATAGEDDVRCRGFGKFWIQDRCWCCEDECRGEGFTNFSNSLTSSSDDDGVSNLGIDDRGF